MADTTIPRNALGDTYDEWLAQQQEVLKSNSAYADLDVDDAIIGMDIAQGVAGFRLSDLGISLGHVVKPVTPAITDNLTTVSGMYGVNYGGMSYGAKTFSIPFYLQADTNEDYQSRIHQLSEKVITPYTAEETTLVFGDDPTVTWVGHFAGVTDPTFDLEGQYNATGTLTFVASNPLGLLNMPGAYAPNQVFELTDTTNKIDVAGNAPAGSIIHILPQTGAKPLTLAGYQIGDNPAEKVMFGESTNQLTMQDTQQTMFSDQLESQDNWNVVTSNSATVGVGTSTVLTNGTLKQNKGSVGVAKFSADETKYTSLGTWHGVGMTNKVGFGSKLGANWEVTVNMNHINHYERATQGVEAYLIGTDGKRHARFGIRGVSGDAPIAYIRFGKDFNDEVKAIATGLGNANVKPAKSSNKKDTTIKLTTTSLNKVYTSDKQVTVRTAYYYGKTSTKKVVQTKTVTTTFNTTTGKSTVKTVWSPKTTSVSSHASQTFWTNNTKPMVKGNVAKIIYWDKGAYKRANDYYKGAIDKKHKYTNSKTAQRKIMVNKTTYDITETNNKKNGTTTTNVKHLTYVNGKAPEGGHPGTLISSSHTVKSVANAKNHATTTTYPTKTIKVSDPNENNTFSDSYVQFKIGHDDKGLYWQLLLLGDDGRQVGKPLVAKTYDKNNAKHSAYQFTPDKALFVFKKQVISEDKLNPKTNKPIKPYTNDSLTINSIKVIKLNKPLKTADIIILKPGQEAIVDTTTRALTIDGERVNYLVNPDSSWPLLTGGATNTVKLTYDPADGYKTILEVRPTIY